MDNYVFDSIVSRLDKVINLLKSLNKEISKMAIGPAMQALVSKVNDQTTVEAGIAMTLTDFIARFQAFVDQAQLGADDEAEAQKLIDQLTESEAPLVAAATNIPPATPPAVPPVA